MHDDGAYRHRSRRMSALAAGVLIGLTVAGCGGLGSTGTGGRAADAPASTTSPAATTPTPAATTPSTTAPAETAPATAGDTHAARVTAKPASRAIPALRLGSRGVQVRALQARLAELTYLPAAAVDGVFGARTWQAVVAFQGWSGLAMDGVVGSRTRKALAHARAPTPSSRVAGIEVHIGRQVLLLVRGGRTVRAIHVSTGKLGWSTPEGRFSVISRQAMSWSRPFRVWMPMAQYFEGGYAIHEAADVPAYPASHGCVRVPAEEAPTVWAFGTIGMRVWVLA